VICSGKSAVNKFDSTHATSIKVILRLKFQNGYSKEKKIEPCLWFNWCEMTWLWFMMAFVFSLITGNCIYIALHIFNLL